MTGGASRLLIWTGLAALMLVLTAPIGRATPVSPDIRKLALEPDPPRPHFGPARAGWAGSEMPALSGNPELDAVIGRAHVRAVRAELVSALLPDRRAVAVILAAILILRRAEQWRVRRYELPTAPAESEEKPLLAA